MSDIDITPILTATRAEVIALCIATEARAMDSLHRYRWNRGLPCAPGCRLCDLTRLAEESERSDVVDSSGNERADNLQLGTHARTKTNPARA